MCVCVCVCVWGLCVCVCVCVFCWLLQTNLQPYFPAQVLEQIWMSIWREALSTCHEGLTSDLVSASGSGERTASSTDVFFSWRKYLIAIE